MLSLLNYLWLQNSFLCIAHPSRKNTIIIYRLDLLLDPYLILLLRACNYRCGFVLLISARAVLLCNKGACHDHIKIHRVPWDK
jgi:hypothetical protein